MMYRNQSGLSPIVPESNAEVIYRYLTGAVTLLGAYAAIVHAWYNSRFKVVNKRIDDVVDDVKENATKVSDHDARFAAMEVHIDNGQVQRAEIKESIRGLHTKLDKIIGGN